MLEQLARVAESCAVRWLWVDARLKTWCHEEVCNVFRLLRVKCDSRAEIHHLLIVLTGWVARRSIPVICLHLLSYDGAWRLLFTMVGMLFILLLKWVSQWILIVAGLFLALLGHQLLSYWIYQHDWESVGGRPLSMTSHLGEYAGMWWVS
jgi:hypothetical protein